MDLNLLLWIAFTNAITNGITGLIIGLFMYWYGKKQGEKSYTLIKAEIQNYIKTDLLEDLKEAIGKQVSDTTKGIFGPFARSVNGEMPEVVSAWAKDNPGVMQMMMNVGKGAVVTKMAKALGVPKDVRDALKGYATSMMLPQQGQYPIQQQQTPEIQQGSGGLPPNVAKALSGVKL